MVSAIVAVINMGAVTVFSILHLAYNTCRHRLIEVYETLATKRVGHTQLCLIMTVGCGKFCILRKNEEEFQKI